MRTRRPILLVLLGTVLLLPAPAWLRAAGDSYDSALVRWRATDAGFATWTRTGVLLADGALVLDAATAAVETDPYAPGAYYGRNFYNGGSYLVGESTGPEVLTTMTVSHAIASWNAETPPGTWIEVLLRAQTEGRWTKWYNLGIWASDGATVERHSVSVQGDADGYVAIDTLVLGKKVVAERLQMKVRLFTADAAVAPAIRNLGLAVSPSAPKKEGSTSGHPALWNVLLDVPECSQMVYPDGGTVWCSPTSTSMVLGYWGVDTRPCEPRVRGAVAGVYDWRYNGYGNWPFNTAYAATFGLESYVARFSSVAQMEPWLKAGVPVVISYGWKKGDLTGAPISSSPGHLAVVVGFDPNGNPIVNDPAAASDGEVQRVYLRDELEQLWLSHSGGTVYLIYPSGWLVPSI